MTTEKATSVPYRYRARLERRFRVSDGEGTLTTEKMSVTGHIHPEPYSHAHAVECAQNRLKLLTDNGWSIVDLRVLSYGETE